MEDIKEKIENKGIVISRIPSWAKEYISTRAKKEFCDDFGQLIASLIKDAEEYRKLKAMFFNGDLTKLLGGKHEQA